MLYPLKFIPVYKDYVWGGRNLKKYGRNLPDGVVAESWDLSCHLAGVSVVSEGELKGISLQQLLKVYNFALLGTNFTNVQFENFPLLVKLIDANSKLSIQVHPADEYAMANNDENNGKNEMWYILEAKPGAKIVYGLIPGTTKRQFEDAIKTGNLEPCLNYQDVFPGDVVNIPAGLIHAIGEGIVIAEVQQSSNSTFRVYDYDRLDSNGKKRDLHIEQALDVIDFEANDKRKKTTGLEVNFSEEFTKIYYIANRYFAAELYKIDGCAVEETDGTKFYIFIVTKGEGEIRYKDGEVIVSKGETVLIPACLGSYMLMGNFEALKVYVPILYEDIVGNLKKAGYSNDSVYNFLISSI